MTDRTCWWQPVVMVLAAAVLWYFAFAVTWGNFWVKISVSASVLAVVSLLIRPASLKELRFGPKEILLGLGSAALLYFFFVVCKFISVHLFSFAGDQIGGIYNKGDATPHWIILPMLFFITGPAEELFWRAYLQRELQGLLGGWGGFAVATLCYAGVHISAWNFMLIGAAGVAGLFWGAFFWRFKNLGALVISHSVWSSVIFAVLPLR